MSRRPGWLAARMLLRQAVADRGLVALLALLVAATAFLASAVVRTVDRASTDGLRQAIATAGPIDRELAGTSIGAPLATPADDPLRSYRELVEGLRRGPGAELGKAAGAPRWELASDELVLTGPPPRDGPGRHFTLHVASDFAAHVRFTSGRPAETATAPPETVRAAAATDLGDPGALPAAPPVRTEIALSVNAARLGRIAVGDELLVAARDGGSGLPRFLLVVTGLFEPLDPEADVWQLDPSALRPQLGETDREGTFRTASAYAGQGALAAFAGAVPARSSDTRITARIGVRADELLPEDASALVQGARRATSTTVPVTRRQDPLGGAAGGGVVTTSLGFTGGPADLVDEYVAERAPVASLAAVLLAGLLGCAVVVVVLAGRLLLERRRPAIALAGSRGASPPQALGLLAAEALLIGAPAAALGAVLADLLVPGRAGTGAWVLTAAVGVLPVPAILASGWGQVRQRVGGGPRGRRRDLVLRRGRSAGELLLAGLTIAAVVALAARGVPGDGVDPLITVTPLLVSASLALLVLRAARPPLAALTRRAAGRSGLVPFLGLARATRSGALGAAVVTAIAVALAVATLAAVTSRTLTAGAAEAARLTVGADLRVQGLGLTEQDAAAVGDLPGVRATALLTITRAVPVGEAVPGGAGSISGDTQVTVLAADPAALAEVQRDLPEAPDLPAALTGGGQPLPVLVSRSLAESFDGPGTALRMEIAQHRVDARVAGVADRLPGAPAGEDWILAPVAGLREASGAVLAPQILLASIDPGSAPDLRAVRAAVPSTTVSTPAGRAEEATSSPLPQALRTGVPVALVAGAALGGTAVVLALLAGAASRRRLLAHLRALGLSGGQAGRLIALEVLPAAVCALVAGLLAGVGLAYLVLPRADLRPLTGATAEVPVTLPVVALPAVTGTFVAVLVLAVLAAALSRRRVSPADAARTGEATE